MRTRLQESLPECAICKQTIIIRAKLGCCSHYFCMRCILTWFNVRTVCPLCKHITNNITKVLTRNIYSQQVFKKMNRKIILESWDQVQNTVNPNAAIIQEELIKLRQQTRKKNKRKSRLWNNIEDKKIYRFIPYISNGHLFIRRQLIGDYE